MASDRAKELWENGVELRNAWLAFAPPGLRAQFEQLSSFVEGLGKVGPDEFRASPMMAIGKALTSASERSKLERQMKEAVLTDLYNEDLLASAYREFPSRSQSPVIIDHEKFNLNDPDWNGEAYEADGIRYFRVRVSRPMNSNESKPGKGSRPLIDDTIDRLCKSNPNFCQLPRKIACEQILQSIGMQRIRGNGLSDKNLEKAILRKCGSKAIRAN